MATPGGRGDSAGWLFKVNDVGSLVVAKGQPELRRFAVAVDGGVKRYGKELILKSLNMHVQEGTM